MSSCSSSFTTPPLVLAVVAYPVVVRATSSYASIASAFISSTFVPAAKLSLLVLPAIFPPSTMPPVNAPSMVFFLFVSSSPPLVVAVATRPVVLRAASAVASAYSSAFVPAAKFSVPGIFPPCSSIPSVNAPSMVFFL